MLSILYTRHRALIEADELHSKPSGSYRLMTNKQNQMKRVIWHTNEASSYLWDHHNVLFVLRASQHRSPTVVKLINGCKYAANFEGNFHTERRGKNARLRSVLTSSLWNPAWMTSLLLLNLSGWFVWFLRIKTIRGGGVRFTSLLAL